MTTKSIKNKLNFFSFCLLVRKYVAGELSNNDLNDLYISYKQGIRVYYRTPTEFILDQFQDRNPTQYSNWLKRNFPNNK